MKREQVREQFPESVKIADEFKAQFGQIRLLHVNEGGKEMGRRSSEKGVKLSDIVIRGDEFCEKRKNKK